MTDAALAPLLLLALQMPGHDNSRQALAALEREVEKGFTESQRSSGPRYLNYLKVIDEAAVSAGFEVFSDPKLTAGYSKMAELWEQDREKFGEWHRKLRTLRDQKWEAAVAS